MLEGVTVPPLQSAHLVLQHLSVVTRDARLGKQEHRDVPLRHVLGNLGIFLGILATICSFFVVLFLHT